MIFVSKPFHLEAVSHHYQSAASVNGFQNFRSKLNDSILRHHPACTVFQVRGLKTSLGAIVFISVFRQYVRV